MRRRTLLLIALLVFAVTLVIKAPAATVYAWLQPGMASSPVSLLGVGGTVTRGHAAQLTFQGRPALSPVSWELQWLKLLLGRASFRLVGGSDGSLIEGVVYAVPSGTVTLSGFRSAVPLKAAFAIAGQPFIPAEGQISAEVESLRLRDGWPLSASGVLSARGLAWKLGREGVLLGDYEATLENETAGIKATIRTLAGALEVSGEARAGNDRRYELQLQMRPKPDAPPLLINLVRSIGQPDAQGWYQLRRSGQMPGGSGQAPDLMPNPVPQ